MSSQILVYLGLLTSILHHSSTSVDSTSYQDLASSICYTLIIMNAHAPINQSINYIESHLTEAATVEKVAAAAGYSRHHFSRLFLALTGLSPASYLRKRRLSEAARELVTSSRRILDIALDYQFGSHEAFARSFKQEFGVSPGSYRQRGRLYQLWGRISLGLSNLLYPGQGISKTPKLFIPERKIVEAVIAPHTQLDGIPDIIEDAIVATKKPLTIRRAHRQDLPALCWLYHELHESTTQGVPERLQSLGDYECFDASVLSLNLRKLMSTLDVSIWVAEVNDEVVGLAEVMLREDEQSNMIVAYRYGYLQSLVVRQPLRGHGIGEKLLQAAEAWSREQGATELRLDTWELDQGPLQFYEQQGYRTLRLEFGC
ncbi:MAG: GNAT family N-acetyltransferase [Chloroflexota bacterium]